MLFSKFPLMEENHESRDGSCDFLSVRTSQQLKAELVYGIPDKVFLVRACITSLLVSKFKSAA